jgi:hypothetical protein
MKSSPVISTIFGDATLREHPGSAEASASRMIVVTFKDNHHDRMVSGASTLVIR